MSVAMHRSATPVLIGALGARRTVRLALGRLLRASCYSGSRGRSRLHASACSVVSPESSECAKRKRKSPSGKEKSSKRFLWTGMEGLEGSSSSDSEPESPSTSASCQSGEQRLHSSESDSDEQAPCSSSSSITTEQSSPQSEGIKLEEATGGVQPICDPGQAELFEQTTDEAEAVSDSGQTAPECSIPEPEEPAITPDLPKESSGPDSTTFDLMSFSSAVELEALGPDKLKVELMVLGLKCGGTLKERAARLFSVRGLSKDQIDPSLFAKPGKAKKK